MKTRIKYRRSRVTVEVPDNFKRKCEICGKEGKIDFHHYMYTHPTKDVKKNPQLALMNTVLLCYKHHRIADALRKIDEALESDRAGVWKIMLLTESELSPEH